MEPSEVSVIPSAQTLRRSPPYNTMSFPQALRDAIPTPPGCWGRALKLASIDGACAHSAIAGGQVRLRFQVAETRKLMGSFEVHAVLNLEAAAELAKTLADLVERAKDMPVSEP